MIDDLFLGNYQLIETKAPESYELSETPIDVNITDDNEVVEKIMTNKKIMNISVEKEWNNAGGDTQPVTIRLSPTGKTIELTKDNNWKATFEGLYVYDESGVEIDYQVEELEVDGFNSSIIGNKEDGFTITNTEITSVSGEKTWLDDNNATKKRPASITVQLLADGKKLNNIKITAKDNWKYSFDHLDKYNAEGEKINYTISELAVEGYKSSIDGFNINNLRKNEISVSGEKSWLDPSPSHRPESIDVKLTRKLKGDLDENFSVTQTVTSDNQGNWKYNFDGFDEFNEEGIQYEYIIEELNVPVGYRSTVENMIRDDKGNINYNITNLRVGNTSLSGNKRWKDDDPADRPDSIRVNLLRNNVVVGHKDVTADDNWEYSFTGLSKFDGQGNYYNYTVAEEDVPGYNSEISGDDITNTRAEKKDINITKGWLDGETESRPQSVIVRVYKNDELFDTIEVKASEDWMYELTDLDAFDKDGQPFVYTIKEKNIDGYETIVNGFNITNKRIGKTTVTGEKTWKDSGSRKRPASIEVKLTREVNGEADENFSKVQTVKAGLLGKWTYTFDELEKYNENGVAYTYRVEENKDVEGYESIVDGYNITNLRVGTTAINVEKIWEDDREQDRPETIQIELLQNGQVIEEVTLSKANNWTHQFTDLEEFDEEGKAYVYTVNEQEVDNYTSSIERDNNTFKITNTFDDEGKVEGEGPGDRPGDKPGSGSGDGPSKGDGPGQPGQSDGKDDEDRLPQTGEANNTLLYVIGTLFILVGLGIGRKKFEQ